MYFFVYVYGWAVFAAFLVQRATLSDVALSHLVALFWPILLPATVLRRLLNRD